MMDSVDRDMTKWLKQDTATRCRTRFSLTESKRERLCRPFWGEKWHLKATRQQSKIKESSLRKENIVFIMYPTDVPEF